jgi:hypothetical protein
LRLCGRQQRYEPRHGGSSHQEMCTHFLPPCSRRVPVTRLGADFWTTVDAVRTPHRPPINSAMPIIKNGPPQPKFVTETRGECEILTPPLARRPAPPSARAAVAAMIAMRTKRRLRQAANAQRRARDRYPFDSPHSLQWPSATREDPAGTAPTQGKRRQRGHKPRATARPCRANIPQSPNLAPHRLRFADSRIKSTSRSAPRRFRRLCD